MRHAYKKTVHIQIPPTAAGATASFAAAIIAFLGVLVSAKYTPNAAITGANTNTRKLEVINKGQAGSGTTVMATLQFNSGVNASAFVPKTITNSAVAGAIDALEGDVIAFVSTFVGTGLADPGGMLELVIERDVSES